MQIAAAIAGYAFTSAGTGLTHGMAHSLGAVCHVHHGAAIGVLLPHVMRFNAEARHRELALVARALGCRENDSTPLPLAAADAVTELLGSIGHPRKLSELGVSEANIAPCVGLTLADDATLANPARVNPEMVAALFQAAL
jgi:1,3-propanediol dehydrogenase